MTIDRTAVEDMVTETDTAAVAVDTTVEVTEEGTDAVGTKGSPKIATETPISGESVRAMLNFQVSSLYYFYFLCIFQLRA